jgi:hypothetical protein
MVQAHPAFKFEHVPLNVDKSSVKVFQNAKDMFSLEYTIFDPKTVRINMYPVPQGRFRGKNPDRALATIQQFASAMGLHPDFHKVGPAPIHLALDLLSQSFQLDPDDPNDNMYYCGGILASEGTKEPPLTNVESFTDDLLEVLTDFPQFAFLQFVFKPIKPPKEFQPNEDDAEHPKPQVRFDIQQGKVERRFNSSITNIIEEIGCFEFSPRILVVETSSDALKSKLNRLSVLFKSNGFKVRQYPSFWRRFNSFKSICIKRKLVSPIILDGYSLMSFIAPPQRQFCHHGYSLVPNKNDYHLSSGLNELAPQEAINIGIPIFSGRTADVPYFVGGKELSRHMAVFGMTGEGKSRFIYGLIREFFQRKVKFIIFDPKGEYLRPLQSICTDFIYFKPGSADFPWGINIFQIPQDKEGKDLIPIEDHIQFVVSVLEHLFEDSEGASPQMRRLLHLAAIETIREKGDLRLFVDLINKPKQLGAKGAYLENTAAGVINRMEQLFFGNTGRCFTVTKTTFEIADLLTNNAIIDLSAFEAMEDQTGRKIFLDVIFQYLYYYVRSFRAPFKEDSLPQNVIILDEIQKLMASKRPRSYSPTSMIGRGPWTLRSYDISMIFIGTDPIVDQPMLSNTGVLTVFFTNFDPYAIANLLGISRDEYERLRALLKAKPNERRCIISINGQISLLKINDFLLNVEHPFDLDALQALPVQKQLRESYQKLVFSPIGTIMARKRPR